MSNTVVVYFGGKPASIKGIFICYCILFVGTCIYLKHKQSKTPPPQLEPTTYVEPPPPPPVEDLIQWSLGPNGERIPPKAYREGKYGGTPPAFPRPPAGY